MQAVIISFDSLAANCLGCYGNEWIETPHWDRLAATGVVFDRHFADSVGPSAGMAWANGQHALSQPGSVAQTSIGSRLRSNGVLTRFIAAGEPQSWQRQAEFDAISTVNGHEGFDAQPDQVPFAQLVRAGLSTWNDDSFRAKHRLLWLHSPGPGIPPIGFDSLYFEDFEERGQQIAELPDEERAVHPAVYAGAVSLIDHWLGELIEGIAPEKNAEPTLVIVMAARGHLWHQISPSRLDSPERSRHSLSDQQIRTPLVLKVINDDRFKGVESLRSDRLVQTCDLVPTLLDWFGETALPQNGVRPLATEDKSDTKRIGDGVKPRFEAIPGDPHDVNEKPLSSQSWLREFSEDVAPRSSLWIGDERDLDAIRTADWLCVRSKADITNTESRVANQLPRVWLYVKPEDIWDVNDISSQQPDVISEMLKRFMWYTG